MYQEELKPAPAIDIVTYGYKAVLKQLKPLTLLALPMLLMAAMAQTGAFWLQFTGDQSSLAYIGVAILVVALGIGGAFGMLYLTYVLSRFVRDLFFAESAERNLYAYYIPKMSLFGIVGIAFIVGALGILAAIAGVIGLLLLVVPGIMVFSLYYVWSSLVYVAYLAKPQQGIFDSMSEIGALLKGNLLRAAGLGILANLIFFLLYAPFLSLDILTEFFRTQPPSFISAPWVPPVYGLMMVLSSWVNMVVGTGGLLFVMNRFYIDLHVRHADNKELTMQGIQRPEIVSPGSPAPEQAT